MKYQIRRGRSHLFTQKGTLYTLCLALQGLRGTEPARAGKLWTGWSFRAVREGGFNRFQCSLRPDPAPLYFLGSAGPGLRAQVSFGQGGAFALCAREGFDRFQCSLRPDPAPLRLG